MEEKPTPSSDSDSEKKTVDPQIEQEQEEEDLFEEDQLLACLILCTEIYHQPLTASTLLAGLPIQGQITRALFIRAAEHAGYSAKMKSYKLQHLLNNRLLPAVLLLEQNKACILLHVSPEGYLEIMDPAVGGGVSVTDVETLQSRYSGHAIFVRPAYRFTTRSEEVVSSQPRRWFWDVMWELWPIYSEVLIASFLINLFALVVPLFSMNVYDRVVPNFAVTTLWVLVSGVFIIFGFDFLLRLLRAYFIDAAAKNVDERLSANIFEKILAIKMAQRPRSVGGFVNTVYSFEIFREFITSTTSTVLVDLPFSIIYLIVILIISGNLVVIPVVAMPIIIIVDFFLQAPLRALTEESQKHAAEKQATLIETLGNIEAVKSGVAEGILQSRWESLLHLSSKINLRLKFLANTSINFTNLIQQLAYIIVIIVGIYKINERDLTVGGLIACCILTSRAIAPMALVTTILTRYHQAMTALRSLDKIMQLEVEKPPGEHRLHRHKLAGNIEFRNVSFNYVDQVQTALNNVSFRIQAGEHVAILGRIGSGKTTIAKLILNLYQPTEGTILIDNIDYLQIDPTELRENIGYAPQDTTLFFGSIRDNIAFGIRNVTDAMILRAAHIAGVDRFTANHPQGLDLLVGERGHNLSAGQRQSVAIARAILLDPPILLFDEPSNSMDDTTEAHLKSNLITYIKNKTLIVVTHKASLLSIVDRIIIIENGYLAADGPRDLIIKELTAGNIKVPKPKS